MSDQDNQRFRVAEYFAGIGLAKMGLEQAGLSVVWSNDISPKKAAMFRGHYSPQQGHVLVEKDLGQLGPSETPEHVDLAWASFPCTDLSLAGTRAGLHSGASSAFWQFVKSISRMGENKPTAIALENVTGFVSSRAGRDIKAAIRAINGLGYSVDVVNIDARRFVPQSRPRLFLICVRDPAPSVPTPSELRPDWLAPIFDDPNLRTHQTNISAVPPLRTEGFTRLAEDIPFSDARWWDAERTVSFLDSLTENQRGRLDALRSGRLPVMRTAYRRMRQGVPRWEIRTDDIAGCLRTARGGSSRQAVVHVGKGEVRVRWMTPCEYARLMGADAYNFENIGLYDSYSGFGDAVCVPVVRWLAEAFLLPALRRAEEEIQDLEFAS